MQIVLLSGGSGKRLWPLSNEIRSKQFIKIFKNDKGEYESMAERTYRSLKEATKGAGITVATAASQVSNIRNQLGDVDVCIEPSRRDTFPAVALACMFLCDVKKVSLDEAVVVCPVDPYVDRDYFEVIEKIGKAVDNSTSNLTLMGIKPTYPSEKYGYIRVDANGYVKGFKEKPDLDTAKQLLEEGALWNGGVFGFKLGYLVDKAHELISFTDYADLLEKYDSLNKISMDYAVCEKETSISVVTHSGSWMDVGTWKTLTMAMDTPSVGNVNFDDTCEDTHVINELDIPILAMGLKEVVVAASPDGILVADKHQSSYMKPYVDKIEGPAMYAEKSWGSYRVLDMTENGLTVKVTLMPGHSMNYHSHERRDEVWTVTEGKGTAVVDGVERELNPGDTVNIPRGAKHTLEASTTLKVIEVQVGTDIDVADKILHSLG